MSVILTPFAKLILIFYGWTGNYGLSIVLFALVVRAILFPFFLKGRKSTMAMSGLTEKQKQLQQKYAKDRQKYSEELQKLYEEENVKPSAGCLWSMLPLPFLMILYYVIRQPLTYLMKMTEDNFNEVCNLLFPGESLNYKSDQLGIAQDVFLNHDKITSSIPELANIPAIDFSFFGLNLSSNPSLLFWKQPDVLNAFGLWLIPVISAVLGLVSMLITNRINAKVLGTQKVVDQSARTMMIMMPLFSLWLCFTLPAALGLYWIANSLFAIIQEFLNVPFLTKYKTKLEEEKVKRAAEKKEQVKKEKQLQAEAKKKAQEEMRRIQMERKLNKNIATASREGLRTYARGRLYDPDRYPITPYRDPNEIAREQWEEQKKAAEERKAAKGKKKSAVPAPVEEAKTETPVSEELPAAAPVEEAAPAPVEETAPVAAVVPEEDFAEEEFVEESFEEETTQEDGEEV